MKRIYHLSSCDNCRKLIKTFNPSADFELVDIKTNSIDAPTLDLLKEKVGSYEAIFSKRAIKYKSLGLKDKNLSEDDFRKLILEEYTFLKRPVLIDGDKVVVGRLRKKFNFSKKNSLDLIHNKYLKYQVSLARKMRKHREITDSLIRIWQLSKYIKINRNFII